MGHKMVYESIAMFDDTGGNPLPVPWGEVGQLASCNWYWSMVAI